MILCPMHNVATVVITLLQEYVNRVCRCPRISIKMKYWFVLYGDEVNDPLDIAGFVARSYSFFLWLREKKVTGDWNMIGSRSRWWEKSESANRCYSKA